MNKHKEACVQPEEGHKRFNTMRRRVWHALLELRLAALWIHCALANTREPQITLQTLPGLQDLCVYRYSIDDWFKVEIYMCSFLDRPDKITEAKLPSNRAIDRELEEVRALWRKALHNTRPCDIAPRSLSSKALVINSKSQYANCRLLSLFNFRSVVDEADVGTALMILSRLC